MEQENKPSLTKTNIVLKNRSEFLLNSKKYGELAECLPKTISEALEEPPIAMLQKKVFTENIVEFMMVELNKLAAMVNVDARLNLQPHQIPFLAQSLVEMYPIETLADFVICFKRGAMGKYGQVFRIDGVVINEWFEKYLDEKYQIRENLHEATMKVIEEEAIKHPTIDWVKKWCELTGYNPIVKENESKRPKKVSLSAAYPQPTKEEIESRELRTQWMRENTDLITGKVTGMEFKEWLANRV